MLEDLTVDYAFGKCEEKEKKKEGKGNLRLKFWRWEGLARRRTRLVWVEDGMKSGSCWASVATSLFLIVCTSG